MRTMRWLILSLSTLSMAEAACTVVGRCTKANIQANGCSEVNSLSEEQVDQLCKDAAYSFLEVNNNYYQQDKNYMDGQGALNDASNIDVEKGRITRFTSNFLTQHKVAWPEYDALVDYSNIGGTKPPYMDNFNMTDACELQTAMCCFTEANDPSLFNAKVCHHDIHDSRKSSHVNRGFASYNNQDAYCVGFSWLVNTEDDYKGNLLADISYNNLLQHGMKKNIPGAPMCGCIEKMPAVTNAACRTVSVTGETYSVESSSLIIQTGGSLTFSDCSSNDLLTSYEGTAEQKTQLENKLVGTCDRDAFLNEHFYIPGANPLYSEPDPLKWQKVAGQGIDYVPHKGFDDAGAAQRDTDFRTLVEACPGRKCIIYRKCSSCAESHQHIYYVRLTDLPSPTDQDFLDLFLNNWFDEPNNLLGTDFLLYSTYADALAGTNPWTFCNYDDPTVGFPRDCGPDGRVNCQWNSHVRDPGCGNRDLSAYSHAFYVEIP
eukprot:CAMPEP_0116564714 /NCGR_PEP_ID=MMETSP0397-20121206/13478_1 /TAXON_ID=216820 /ORGANISM="Cyclophora tenuis, Strain ECT3854" /LENGTH=486 /DNA_ID=CAMNT_0004091371 /DNA_START=1 /DNA_END=1461 /DNA_ORIENTATION=-